MKELGLVGKNISYSFSEKYFNDKFKKENITDYSYQLFDLEKIDEITTILSKPNLLGFNITIPYKKDIIQYIDELSPSARKIQAVNTVLNKNGKLTGYNTDAEGFRTSLLSFIKDKKIEKALVLGTGGASLAVCYVLDLLGIPYFTVSRNSQKADFTYNQLSEKEFSGATLIVNCTPLGTFPQTESCPPLPYELVHENCFAHDLVYNPTETTFMKKCLEQGAKVKNGLEMLHQQAEEAWRIWHKNT